MSVCCGILLALGYLVFLSALSIGIGELVWRKWGKRRG